MTRKTNKLDCRDIVPVSQDSSSGDLRKGAIARFKRSNCRKSCWQVLNSVLPFCGLWYLMYASSPWSYCLSLVLAIPTAGLLVRLFIIQHDCGHQSFFRSRAANDLLGTACSIFTLTPYRLWRRTHSQHHATSGDLDRRGYGDVWLMTVNEYRNQSFLRRLQYRVYRHPLFLFVVGPSLLFIVRQRFSLGIPAAWHRERRSVHLTNLWILVVLATAWLTIGLPAFLLVHLPVVMIAASIGSWMFFVQHQYEDAYWQAHEQWNFQRAAIEGSSYFRLPPILQWFTGNIGFHHIHHLESGIPNYNLPLCHAALPELRRVVTLSAWDGIRCTRLKLWDDRRQRLIAFSELKSVPK